MDVDDDEDEQGEAWGTLYNAIQFVLEGIAREDSRGRADYWLLDDNWGPRQHKLYINNLSLLAPSIVAGLQQLLSAFPTWEIVLAIDVRGPGESWPEMFILIRAHEIVDGLQRGYLPEQYRGLHYEGSRRAIEGE